MYKYLKFLNIFKSCLQDQFISDSLLQNNIFITGQINKIVANLSF
jgi:hypothetical protein